MAGGDYTAVQFGGMQQGEQDFMAVFNAFTSTLSDLQHNLESSLSEWTGSARTAYTAAKAAWDQSAQHMAQVLNQLGTVIGDANTVYQDTERQLTNLWSS